MDRSSKAGLLLVMLVVGGLIAVCWAYCGYVETRCPTEGCPAEGGQYECTPEGCRPIQEKPAKPSDKPPTVLPDWRPSIEQLERLRLDADAPGERPVVDLPEAMRTKNYLGGSCVHASTINLLKWQGQEELAKWWRENHGHGEYAERLAEKMEAANLKFAYVTNGDPAFIEWAIRTRRGAGIGYFPSHAINIVGLTPTHAILLDNNRTQQYLFVPREEFFRRWKNEFGGWAWSICYDPPAPRPTKG